MAVSKDWRLTGVRLGEWDLDSNPDCVEDIRGKRDCAPPFLDVSVEESISHPDYDPWSRSRQNDIALLRLSISVSFNDFVQPVCLPYSRNLRTATFENREMIVSGWAQTEKSATSSIKLKATIKGWEFDRCKNKYMLQRINIQSTQMCAGGVSGVDSCQGDSGGPLMVMENIDNRPRWLLVGIVSFGPVPCGQPGWPGVYTRTADFIDWIENTIRA